MKYQHTELYKLLQDSMRQLSIAYEETRKVSIETGEVFALQINILKRIARKQRNYQRYQRQYRRGGERKKHREASRNY